MCGFLCIFRVFPVCALCSGVFSFLQSLPPPPFFRSNSFRCSIASSILSLCASSVQLYSFFLSRYLLLFLQPLPIPFISLLCTPPDTYPALSLCVFCPDTSSSLSSFLSFLSPSLGFPFPLCVFSVSLPRLPGAIPPFPRRLFLLFLLRSRVFLPLFSAPFLSFVFHLEKSFPLNRG